MFLGVIAVEMERLKIGELRIPISEMMPNGLPKSACVYYNHKAI